MSEVAVTFDTAAAERRAERIRLRLDSIADGVTAVLPMIREAIEKGDPEALGYRSVGEYVADRFGSALSRLPVDLRRPVVHELHAAGMSTRAIAPVVGVTQKTVVKDMQVIPRVSPAPPVDRDTGEILDPPHAPVVPKIVDTPATATTGLDGKTYTRTPSAPARATARRPLTDSARDAGWDLTKSVERLERIASDDRFAANKEAVALHVESHLTNAIKVCQDLLDRINN